MPQETDTIEPPPSSPPDTDEELCAICADVPVGDCDCCTQCESTRDDCTCCSLCSETERNCTCRTCECCGDRFQDGDRYCCEDYCSSRCAERDEHYHCACGDVVNTDSCSCESCNRYECCRSFECSACHCCTRCCDCESGPIEEYSSRNYPATFPACPPYTPYLYLGAENEVECGDHNRETAAQHIYDAHSDKLLLKSDGSLNDGFEMVTGKLSLEKHQEYWPLIAKTAVEAGARSWKHKTTGFHIHLSRNWFTPLALGKLLVFINSDKTRTPITKLAGRDASSYAEFKKKKITQYGDPDGRYEAVNLTNRHTIEIRIFKGTLKAERILAYLEFAHALAHWSKECSIAEVESWDSLVAYANKWGKLYKHFLLFNKTHIQTGEEN